MVINRKQKFEGTLKSVKINTFAFMKINERLDLKDVGFANQLILDYLDKKSEVKGFYEVFPDKDGLLKSIKDRGFSTENRETLHASLIGQHKALDLTMVQKSNLDLIKDSKSRTVTAGHQLCLFTGPLYTIYKIASTIKLAQELNANSKDYPVVPIFWMATEDHDFDEVNHAYFFSKKLEWEHEQGDAVGRMQLNGIDSLVEELATILGKSELAVEAIEEIKSAYNQNENLAQATRSIIHYLFKDFGLLILDGDDKELKKSMIPVFEKELKSNDYETIVNKTSDRLVAAGYKKQVNPRPINIFYLGKGLRHRIIKHESGFEIDNSGDRHSEEVVFNLLKTYPERFSPNVIMRPLYQEIILPNIAFIGGPGELTYWMQLKDGFTHFNIPFPALILRNLAMIVDPGNQKKIVKLGLKNSDLFGDVEEKIKERLMSSKGADLSLHSEKEDLIRVFDHILKKTHSIDQSVMQFAKAEKQKLINAVDGVEKKLIRAEKKNNDVQFNQIRTLKEKLFPNGGPQERRDNVFQYYLIEGKGIIGDLIEEFNPLDFKYSVFYAERK